MPLNRDDVKGGMKRGLSRQDAKAAVHAYRATGHLPSTPQEPQLRPATANTEKPIRRYKPAYQGEKPAGYEPVGTPLAVRGPQRRKQRPFYEVAPDTRTNLERAVDQDVTPILASGQKLASPALTVPAAAAGNVLAQLGGGPAAVSVAEHLQHGQVLPAAVSAAGLLPFGKFGRLAKAAKEATALEDAGKLAGDLSPEQQLREGLKGARSRYGVEKAARKEEVAQRAKAADEALRTITDPHEALAASGAALRGKYAQIDFKGLKELNPETVKHLMTHAQNHPTLGAFSKRTVMQALDAAVVEGRVPRPHELRLIEMVFGKKTAAGLVEQARKGWGDKVINALNIPRSLQATADVSGLMRQNLVAGASHPIIWSRNAPKAFKAMKGENFERYAQEVKDDPLYPMAVQAGVQFTDLGEHAALAAHEEGFASDYATHIPAFGHVIKGSARAYVATGNAMKMGVFANRIRLAQAAGQNIHDEKALSQIAQVVNAATGRGTLPGRAEHLLPAMNTFMFSPRLMLARLHYLDPTWYFRLKGPARREALRGLFATAGGVTSALYLFSHIPGVDVGSLDPRSADFGKLKVNNTRIDLAGGFQQYVRLAAVLATQTQVSSTSGKKTKLGSAYGVPTGWDVMANFGINKLAPAPGLGVNIARGHDAVGNKLTWDSLAQNYLTPLSFQDAKDIYNEKHGGVDGITYALGGYGLAAMGLGLQTYPPKAEADFKNQMTTIDKAVKAGQLSPERAAEAKKDLERVHYVQTHDSKANRRQFLIDTMRDQGYAKDEINAALHQLGYDPAG